jgi:aryl-alcohol dehydrogenase-like predicted oxidoreductase
MTEERDKIGRRSFLKTVGAVGVASILASTDTLGAEGEGRQAKEQKSEFPLVSAERAAAGQVPRRKLGKTGVEVSCLALGTIFDVMENQTVLRNAVKWGVTYWDTAPDYAGPNSELGIGKFIAANPDIRKKLFISTKASDAVTIEDVEKALQASLKRLNTDYIDLYHVMDRVVGEGYAGHGLSDPGQLTDDLKEWVKSAKKRKLIKFFGFPTHQNIPECLTAAAKLDWIDVVMFIYNFRLMQDPKMAAAIDACHKAGIGLVAMKTQARRIISDEDKKLTDHFMQRGFTEGQAKIKVVLEDKRFSSACVRMENIVVLTENVAASLDKTKLSQADMRVFNEYARQTQSSYCPGCARICSSLLPGVPCVSDIMRYLMYHNSYGDQARARQLFAQIPDQIKGKLLSIDYGPAEVGCPQRLPIGKLVAEAVSKLA